MLGQGWFEGINKLVDDIYFKSFVFRKANQQGVILTWAMGTKARHIALNSHVS
jgi:hypothetical protein